MKLLEQSALSWEREINLKFSLVGLQTQKHNALSKVHESLLATEMNAQSESIQNEKLINLISKSTVLMTLVVF